MSGRANTGLVHPHHQRNRPAAHSGHDLCQPNECPAKCVQTQSKRFHLGPDHKVKNLWAGDYDNGNDEKHPSNDPPQTGIALHVLHAQSLGSNSRALLSDSATRCLD